MSTLEEEVQQLADVLGLALGPQKVVDRRHTAAILKAFQKVQCKTVEACAHIADGYVPRTGALGQREWQIKREMAAKIRSLLPQSQEVK